MDLIRIERVNDCDVVDSRLIAMELEIQHKNFLTTVKKYKTEIEQDFGALAFQTDGLQGTASYAEYCYLNEEQATYVMTLSKNTDKVRYCKRKLVKSFAQAKKVIASQNDRIRELEMQLEISRNQKYILDKSEAIVSLHGVGMLALIQGRPDAVVEIKEKVTETVICK